MQRAGRCWRMLVLSFLWVRVKAAEEDKPAMCCALSISPESFRSCPLQAPHLFVV